MSESSDITQPIFEALRSLHLSDNPRAEFQDILIKVNTTFIPDAHEALKTELRNDAIGLDLGKDQNLDTAILHVEACKRLVEAAAQNEPRDNPFRGINDPDCRNE